MREFEGIQIWDDPPPTHPPTQDQLDRIKAWFDERVASGEIEVLTVKVGNDTVTFIRAGGTRNEHTGEK